MLSLSCLIINAVIFSNILFTLSSLTHANKQTHLSSVYNQIDPNKIYNAIFNTYFNHTSNLDINDLTQDIYNNKEIIPPLPSPLPVSPIDIFGTTPIQINSSSTEHDYESIEIVLPNPPLLGQSANKPEEPTFNKGPQPFTVLMNFQNDGTTSLQILNQHNLYWSDLGNCRHGQIFDPTIGVCRDVFCMEGYILSPDGCVADSNYNKTAFSEPIKKPAPEMQIEITLVHNLCTFMIGINETVNCLHETVMEPSEALLSELKNKIIRVLQINSSRIENITFVKYEIVNETSMTNMYKKRAKRDLLNDNDRFVIEDLINNLNSQNENFNLNNNDNKNSSKVDLYKIEKIERLTISFKIKDMKLFPNEKKETIILFYYLTMFALDQKHFVIKNHAAIISDVYEQKDSPDQGWCNSPSDEKMFIRSEFRIMASFHEDDKPKYYVYVNQTETLYSTGYYYLTLLYQQKHSFDTLFYSGTTTKPSFTNSLTKFDLQKLGLNEITFNLENQRVISDDFNYNYTKYIKLTDITDIVLDQNTSNILASKLLTVCNRKPKIRVKCENHQTIRLRLCELELMKDKSYCSLGLKACFFIDEYEYDLIEPENYIRICKSYKNHSIQSYYYNMSNFTQYDPNRYIAGWVSLLSTIISIFFMLITLLTYSLFKQIRNLPGWNIISVTIALTIAHSSFLLGSFLNQIPLACFLIGLSTHYGFLASFFWMNIIAFDLFRNFRNKSSHVLINSIRLKERLPKYSIYAWFTPLVIVIVGLIVDLSLTDPLNKAPYRPCYSGYLRGCSTFDSEVFYINDTDRNLDTRKLNSTDQSCLSYTNYNLYSKVLILNGPCWIRNGRANLIFFGLPIGCIIILNGIFYFIAVYNIRKKKNEQKGNGLRRFSKVKLPGDEDVKFYIQMACIMGFTWIIGFFLTTISSFSSKFKNIEIIYNILTYLFIILNASTGVFIFFAFLFRNEIRLLYKKFFEEKILKTKTKSQSIIGRFNESRKSRIRENSQSSTSNLYFSNFSKQNVSAIKQKNSISTVSSTTDQLDNNLERTNMAYDSSESRKSSTDSQNNFQIHL